MLSVDFKLTDPDAQNYSRTENYLLHLDMPEYLRAYFSFNQEIHEDFVDEEWV